MPKLILQFEGRVLKECAVGASASIGRLPDNAVVIDNPAVSSRHARVVREGESFVLEDLKSTNGTFVNGTRITRHTLQDGDVVLIGKHAVVFEAAVDEESADVESPEPVLAGFGGTVFLDTKQQKALLARAHARQAESEAPTAPVAVGEPAKSAAASKVATLHVLAGPSYATEYTLRGHTSVIGKSDSALVPLKGWFKPKTALAIARKENVYTATVLGGKTLLNNQPLDGRQELKDGDVLQVCGLTLEFRLR
jgi:pSer/pThr/pTyr-binding forkhead associated (FHA) protein